MDGHTESETSERSDDQPDNILDEESTDTSITGTT